MTKIKICGLYRPCDVEYVNQAQPDWCGFIINFPKSHRNVTPEQARELRSGLSRHIRPVGVFVDRPPEEVAALLDDGTLAAAQLHGHEDETYIARLRSLTRGHPMWSGYEIWKAFKIRGPADLDAANASTADLVLLDNGSGTGERFDWSILDRPINRPWLLAGGLTPDNIPEAIRALAPWGIDLSSGVETDGRKDPDKIMAAVAAARRFER